MFTDPKIQRRERRILFALVALATFNTPAFIVLAYYAFHFHFYTVPSNAMAPALQAGDYFADFTLIDRRHLRRGEVVTFYRPTVKEMFVKRIVGLPGDTVQMRHGVVNLNGKPVVTEDAGSFRLRTTSGKPGLRCKRLIEHLAPGEAHYVIDLNPNGPGDNTGPTMVTPGHYFVLGDNRDASNDSRFDLGLVAADNVRGRLVTVVWNSDLQSLARRRP